MQHDLPERVLPLMSSQSSLSPRQIVASALTSFAQSRCGDMVTSSYIQIPYV